MNSSDFAKQNMILKNQVAEMNGDLQLKQNYIDDLKQNIKIALQKISTTSDSSQQQ